MGWHGEGAPIDMSPPLAPIPQELLRALKPATVRDLQTVGLWGEVARALARKSMHQAKVLARTVHRHQEQLSLDFEAPKRAPSVRRDVDIEDIPVGSTVRTPTGRLAVVIGRTGKPRGGGQRDHFERLKCRYQNVKSRRGDVVTLQAKDLEVISYGA